MGAEATCTARVDGKKASGKALLETKEVIFRPAEGARVVVPFAEISTVSAQGGVLELAWAGRKLALELGSAAEKWAGKIKNPPTLLEKLGIKGGQHAIFFRAEKREDLERLPKLKEIMEADTALWILRPKGVKEITEAEVMAAGKAAGLVDVKVVAFSETHTAEKFVIPVSQRSAKPKR